MLNRLISKGLSNQDDNKNKVLLVEGLIVSQVPELILMSYCTNIDILSDEEEIKFI